MTFRLTIGIDPGISGAIAVLADGRYHDVLDMPTMGRGKGARQQVNAVALVGYLRDLMVQFPGAHIAATIEDVASRPTDSGVGAFAFGRSVGMVEGALAAVGIGLERVTPASWKGRAGLRAAKGTPSGAIKEASRGRATELFPRAPLTRKKDHGRAEALLIARDAWIREVDGVR